jgi:hypothetical protein
MTKADEKKIEQRVLKLRASHGELGHLIGSRPQGVSKRSELSMSETTSEAWFVVILYNLYWLVWAWAFCSRDVTKRKSTESPAKPINHGHHTSEEHQAADLTYIA